MLAISLGAVCRNLCRFGEALQHLERARELGAGQPHFRDEDRLRQLAALWAELGRVNLARAALDEAAQLNAGGVDVALVDVVRARCLLAQREIGAPLPAEEVLALLAPAEATLTRGGDRRALRRLWLLKARVLPAADGVALLQAQLAEPSVARNPGAALPLTVRLAQAWLACGEAGQARRAAERAADWLAAVQPLEMTPGEIWLTLALAAKAEDDLGAAREACARGLAFVQEVAAQHLEPVYRESWLQRNAVNRQLATLAARLAT
jgi:tetratricopeptide (TPR) repeat protein